MKNAKLEIKTQNGEAANGEIPPEESAAAALKSGVQNEEFETEFDTLDPISAARNGKIAALSRDVRESLNRQIRGGQPGPDILEWLNAEASVVEVLAKRFEGKPVTRQNLWEWRHGGYKQWARHRAACLRLNHKRKGKRIDRHQLGDEMAQLYAEELTVTLDELIDFAPDSEVRMQRLEKGLNQIRGWRRNDYHAQRMVLQTERMALDREKLQWRSECQSQELALKEKRLALDRDKFERTHAEYIVNTCNNPKIGAAARKKGVSYARKVKEVDTIMFGIPTEQVSTVTPNGNPESGVQSQSNAQGGLPGAQSGKGAQEKGAGVDNIEHPTPNTQHPVEGAKGKDEKGREGDESVPQTDSGKALQNEQNDAVKQLAPSPSVVPGRPQNETKKTENKEQTPTTKHQTPNNLQPSTCNLEPSADGLMTVVQADKIASEWKAKVKSFGGIIINNWDVAELSAYLSGQPRPWYSVQSSDHETMYPPTRDPRYNPESPWCRAWKCIEQERRANEKN